MQKTHRNAPHLFDITLLYLVFLHSSLSLFAPFFPFWGIIFVDKKRHRAFCFSSKILTPSQIQRMDLNLKNSLETSFLSLSPNKEQTSWHGVIIDISKIKEVFPVNLRINISLPSRWAKDTELVTVSGLVLPLELEAGYKVQSTNHNYPAWLRLCVHTLCGNPHGRSAGGE